MHMHKRSDKLSSEQMEPFIGDDEQSGAPARAQQPEGTASLPGAAHRAPTCLPWPRPAPPRAAGAFEAPSRPFAGERE